MNELQGKAHYISVTGIIRRNGKFLICKRSSKEKAFPNKWCVPGGKVERQDFEKRRKECKNPNNIDIIIDSGGGDADAAYHISKLLHRTFKGKISYIIPRYAKSAATLLVSGGNEIVMGPTSELGPLDPQIQQQSGDWISAKSVQSTFDLIKKYTKSDLKLATVIASRLNPLLLGQYESTLRIAKEYQKEL